MGSRGEHMLLPSLPAPVPLPARLSVLLPTGSSFSSALPQGFPEHPLCVGHCWTPAPGPCPLGCRTCPRSPCRWPCLDVAHWLSGVPLASQGLSLRRRAAHAPPPARFPAPSRGVRRAAYASFQPHSRLLSPCGSTVRRLCHVFIAGTMPGTCMTCGPALTELTRGVASGVVPSGSLTARSVLLPLPLREWVYHCAS